MHGDYSHSTHSTYCLERNNQIGTVSNLGNKKFVELLINSGAQIDAVDRWTNNAIELANEYGNLIKMALNRSIFG